MNIIFLFIWLLFFGSIFVSFYKNKFTFSLNDREISSSSFLSSDFMFHLLEKMISFRVTLPDSGTRVLGMWSTIEWPVDWLWVRSTHTQNCNLSCLSCNVRFYLFWYFFVCFPAVWFCEFSLWVHVLLSFLLKKFALLLTELNDVLCRQYCE